MVIVLVVTAAVLITVAALLTGLLLRRRIGGTEREILEDANRGRSLADRFRISRAVQKGRSVADPSLAGAAVVRARYVQSFGSRFQTRGWRWTFGLLALVQAANAVLRVVETDSWDVWRVILVAGPTLMVGLFLTLPWQHRFYRRRAEQAERLNAELAAGRAGVS